MVSPLRASDFRDMPPAIIHTAEYDPLCDEGALYAIELARAGVAVSHCRHPGMIHHFYGLGGAIPYASTALAAIGAEVRAGFALTERRIEAGVKDASRRFRSPQR